MALTPQQQQVVDSNAKKIVVLSCAGSGKTTVITSRIVRLWDSGVQPEEILALTFSNKASQEMKKRICRENPKLGARVNVKTFHAFGLEIIRKYNNSFGFMEPVKIAKASDVQNILRDIFKKSKGNSLEGAGIIEYIKHCKSFSSFQRNPSCDIIFSEYTNVLRERSLVDMEDMIWLTVNFLQENESARNIISNQYRYIFVDEYQDTNEGQNRLLDLLIHEDTNLCLVGDDDQAIYEWRGAKPEYIRQKALSGEYELLKLEKNFRSQDGIIQVANSIICKNTKRVNKTIQADRPLTFKPIYTRLSNADQEAKFVAQKISELVRAEKYNPSDIAVLFRNNEQAAPIKTAFEEAGIDFDSCELDDNAQYTQFINVLSSIATLNSTSELSDAINFPERCFDRFNFIEAKEAYCDCYGQDSNYSTMDWINRLYLSDVSFENSDVFRERYRLITQLHQATNWKPTQIIAVYLSYFESKHYDTLYPEKYHFVLQTFDIAKNYEECYGGATLKEFLYHLNLTLEAHDTTASVNLDAVNLLTMHRSKGLEFKVVFIVGVQVGITPNDYFIHSNDDLEAERRLFYVAITRAKELLFFTSYKDPFGAGGNSPFIHHGFMAEIPQIAFSQSENIDKILSLLPQKKEQRDRRTTAELANDVIDNAVKTVKVEIIPPHDEAFTKMPQLGLPATTGKIPESSTICKELETDGLTADGKGLKDLSEDQVDRFMELSIALSKEVIIPDDKFVVIVGSTDIKTSHIHGLFKANSIKKYELYDYEGKGFNLNRFTNNYRCIGIILGPEAHKMEGINAVSLKGKLLSAPEAYPYMIDLIDRHITKTSLQEAIVKIKWNYSQAEIPN